MKKKSNASFYDAWRDFTPDEHRLHETYEGRLRLLPELEITGWLLFSKAMKNALHPSRHQNFYEILYMEHGLVDWWVEDSSYAFNAGQVLVIRPNELHGASCGVLQPCEHYWLRFAFPKEGSLPGLTEAQTHELEKAFRNLNTRLFTCSEWVKRGFKQLINAHRLSHNLITETAARAAFHSILCYVALDSAGKRPQNPTPLTLSPRIQQALKILQDQLEHPPPVKQLARQVNMSEGAFRKLFEKETGVAPNNYINIQRIRGAKEQLQQGVSITEVAFAAGFSSSQYFATVFKRWAGLSPSEYLEQVVRRQTRAT